MHMYMYMHDPFFKIVILLPYFVSPLMVHIQSMLSTAKNSFVGWMKQCRDPIYTPFFPSQHQYNGT